MKTTILQILLLSSILFSCGKDEVAPLLELSLDKMGSDLTYFRGDTLHAVSIATDNEELERIEAKLTIGNTVEKQVVQLSGTMGETEWAFVLDLEGDAVGTLSVTVTDRCGLKTTEQIVFEYKDVQTGTLDLKMKLTYEGAPLLTFTDYSYPDGRAINFTRFSVYLADVSLDNTYLAEIDFHNFTSINSTASGAAEGLTWSLEGVPTGSYGSLQLGVGVPPRLNAEDPSAYPSGHPLARPAEHWFSWGSYIFMKIEGNLDADGDGDKELPISLHLGADEAYRILNLAREISIGAGETAVTEIEIDVYEMLGGADDTYDIDANPQIHSLNQVEAVIELADNIEESIH